MDTDRDYDTDGCYCRATSMPPCSFCEKGGRYDGDRPYLPVRQERKPAQIVVNYAAGCWWYLHITGCQQAAGGYQSAADAADAGRAHILNCALNPVMWTLIDNTDGDSHPMGRESDRISIVLDTDAVRVAHEAVGLNRDGFAFSPYAIVSADQHNAMREIILLARTVAVTSTLGHATPFAMMDALSRLQNAFNLDQV